MSNSTNNSNKNITLQAPTIDDVDDILSSLGIKTAPNEPPKPKKKPKKKNANKTEDDNTIEGEDSANKTNTNNNANKKENKKQKQPEPPKISAQAEKIKLHLAKVAKEKEEREKKLAEERAIAEEINRRRKEEQARLLAIKEEKKRKKREKIEKAKKEGTYLTTTQKKKLHKENEARDRLLQFISNQSKLAKEVIETQQLSDDNTEEESDNDEKDIVDEEALKQDVLPSSWEEMISLEDSESSSEEEEIIEPTKINLRAAICCVLGHVDTGKTKILDKIRHTNVQEGEAGGITQQIGATFFPIEALSKSIDAVRKVLDFEYEIPGLLMIDTPGHESFSNLRSRGSSLCDISVLVVDIMHGLEKQTLESLELLIAKKCPFVVALNKIDRMYGWKVFENEPFLTTFNKQTNHSQEEFKKRLKATKLEFNEKGFNAELYYDNKDFANTISLVPTSAHTGQGIPDLLGYITFICQKELQQRFIFKDRVDCTVLELKTTEGFGTTIDVILVNGVLHQNDRVVLCGFNGPIVTEIRVLLTPEPMKEIRTKTSYIRHNEIKAAMGIKISANDLDECVPGTPLFVCNEDDRLEYYKTEVTKDLNKLKMNFKKSEEGVWVQSSSLGSLEALLDFLSKSKPSIPVSGFNIGPLSKRDITEASVVLNRRPEFGVILAFDIKIDHEIELLIKQTGLKLFSEQIIYRLFDSFTAYMKDFTDKQHQDKEDIIFPCELKCVDNINNKDPIIMGVDVIQGVLKVGMPIAAIKFESDDKKIVELGKVSSIQINKQNIDNVKPGTNSVAISIQPSNENQRKMQFGRTFDLTYKLYSRITRASIDIMKNEYREKLQPTDWILMKDLKEYFNII